ncbi:MAG: S41 family peptidase [Oscillospiraceae bacterium]|nr:S41 family peptidase [Oscillospiraceae bacterium]
MKKKKWLLLLMCCILLALPLTACDTESNDGAIEPEVLEIPPDSFENEILADFDLPDIRHDDIDRMHYGAPAGRVVSIEPIQSWGNFEGKVWMLVNHQNGSAAQAAAWYASETGHITLVGDRTGGVLGGPRTMALMPNTGIAFYFDIFYVTDRHGRPLEAGTIPHYFNHPGMDALETVLALIDEWDS